MDLTAAVKLRGDVGKSAQTALNDVYDPMFRSDLRLHAMTVDLYHRAGSNPKVGTALRMGISHRSLCYFSEVRDVFGTLESWYNLQPDMDPGQTVRNYIDRHYLRWHKIVDMWYTKLYLLQKSLQN